MICLSRRLGNKCRPPAQRRGAVTVVALVVLVILAGLVGQHVRRVLMERRQFRQEILHLQAEKLADAGINMAIATRKKDTTWGGVTWKTPSGAIHQTNTADVEIKIEQDVCTVIVRYPTNNNSIPFKVTRTRKLTP